MRTLAVQSRRAGFWLAVLGVMAACRPGAAAEAKFRIYVVDSYHRGYLWSQDTQRGLCAGLIEFGFMETQAQARALTDRDQVETRRAVVKKAWMDTKHRNSRAEIARAVARIMRDIDAFKPDLILLGDDNATNYIGNQYVDTDVPVVFWGVNGEPLKYGLLDSMALPGHNVTGIYQAGYMKECVEYLALLVPGLKTFAILADDSPTGRSKAKELRRLAAEGRIPLKLAGSVVTDSYERWKAGALQLQRKADSFFVLNHNTLRGRAGRVVDQLEAGAWYLRHVRKPDCAQERQFAVEGVLLVVDDSGYKQAFEAVRMAKQILLDGRSPARMPVRSPSRGPVIVNRQRAKTLGIDLAGKDFVDEALDTSLALKTYPADD